MRLPRSVPIALGRYLDESNRLSFAASLNASSSAHRPQVTLNVGLPRCKTANLNVSQTDEPMEHLELTKLLSYDDTSVIAEIRRVMALLPPGPVTVAAFDRLSKVHSTTLRNRFGGWRQALAAAGIDERFNDSNARRTRDEVIKELNRVAGLLGKIKIGRSEFEKHSRFKSKAVCTAFGTFPAALQAAGLAPLERHDRSDEECFENVLALWSHYGRAPTYGELRQPPSQISGKIYARRWGGWRKALRAFMERVNNVDLALHADLAISPPNVARTRLGRSRRFEVSQCPRGIASCVVIGFVACFAALAQLRTRSANFTSTTSSRYQREACLN